MPYIDRLLNIEKAQDVALISMTEQYQYSSLTLFFLTVLY